MAGAIFDPGYEPNFKWADYDQSYRLAQFHCRDGDKAGRLLEYLWSEAERIVNLRWRQVEAVANALLKRSRLTSSEIQEILAGASPCQSAEGTGFLAPLLRGSVYLHAQCLRHGGHSSAMEIRKQCIYSRSSNDEEARSPAA